MNDISSYSIHNPKQITANLSLLVKSKSLLSARIGGGGESYITTLLAIDHKTNTVILDYGAKEDLNERILKAGKVAFDTDFNGIKVSFVGSGLKKATFRGDTVFVMPVPKSMYWMQRREYFRVKSPLTKPSYCQLTIEGKKPVNLKLYDISLTGFAMLNVSKEVSELLVPGSIIEKSKLILADAGEGPISYEICAKYIINPDKIQKIQKIGCKFVNLSRSVEEIIQRYMQQIQREDIQKEGLG